MSDISWPDYDEPEFLAEGEGFDEEPVSPGPAPYWQQTREPLSCLVFLLPLLLIYEAGILLIGGDRSGQLRNGADYWMRNWLAQAGIDSLFLLPLLVIGVLLIWHRIGRFEWQLSRETLVGMFAESLLLAVGLLFLAQVQDMAFQCWLPGQGGIRESTAGERPLLAISSGFGRQMISYVGAGVYEEVLFRLALLPACLFALRSLNIPAKWDAVLAVLLTSLAFSVAHYIGPAGEPFSVFSFTFRATAGCFFATVFLLRGFGITVGCHALYDVLVGILIATNS